MFYAVTGYGMTACCRQPRWKAKEAAIKDGVAALRRLIDEFQLLGPFSVSQSSMLVVLKFPYSIGCLPGVISKTKDVCIRIID